MGGQIIDATDGARAQAAQRSGGEGGDQERPDPRHWKDKSAKLQQKDRDARWSVKYTKAKVTDGADPRTFKPVDLAIPVFGYKNHIGIGRTHDLIRTWDASAANAHDGARLPVLISPDNTA